jgi:hypothetical protein
MQVALYTYGYCVRGRAVADVTASAWNEGLRGYFPGQAGFQDVSMYGSVIKRMLALRNSKKHRSK